MPSHPRPRPAISFWSSAKCQGFICVYVYVYVYVYTHTRARLLRYVHTCPPAPSPARFVPLLQRITRTFACTAPCCCMCKHTIITHCTRSTRILITKHESMMPKSFERRRNANATHRTQLCYILIQFLVSFRFVSQFRILLILQLITLK